MYLPVHFREERPEELRALIERHPLAALVTAGKDGLTANHIPLLYDPSPAPLGTLEGHIARGNPLWNDCQAGVDALAIFQGPEAYISPNWYPTRAQDGRVVPTWNYVVVHVWGRLTAYTEPERLRLFLDRLTAVHEREEAVPWTPADAPTAYIDGLLQGIAGIEFAISRIEGKWKVSQNQPEENRLGAADALKGEMSGLIRRAGYTSPGS
ncbi:MAG: FMN-binding negative transcriptional regulator [Terriglobia bacterium]